ncbi:hypothetical protein QFC24_002801 [Naganishia onofrii]|uniref:Uncharacterized protein n=1 Tax=Naganishia onofrii TaxID=1851511 RepID=A0ACC2XNN6_9TREE|nr:hypothetical protein QFC24_002801 [Naganishia onofrii]
MSPPTPKVTDEEEDVDDLDDLDDLLDDFAAARPSKPAPAPAHVPTTQPADTQASSSSFEDELSRNMAALFASLGSAPSPPSAPAAAAAKGDKRDPATDDGDDDRESQQLQHLFQQLLKSDPALAAEGFPAGLMDGGEGADGGDGESLEALLASLTGSLTNNQPTPPLQAQALAQQKTSKASSSSVSGTENNKTRTASSSNGESSSSTAGAGTGVKLSFEETIKQTMNNMKASEQESRSRSSKPDTSTYHRSTSRASPAAPG